jgi:hypothetical protein
MSADAPTDDAPVTDDPAADDPGGEGPGADEPGARPRSGRSVGPLIALGLAVVLVVAAIGVAIVGGDDVSATAVRVNTFEVSQKTFNSELRDLAAASQSRGASPSEYSDAFLPSSTAARVAQFYVYAQLLRGHVKVSESERQAAIAENEDVLGDLGPGFRDAYVDYSVRFEKLVDQRGQAGALQLIGRLARRADVYVDLRYGFWDPVTLEVCPLTGCPSPSSGG